MSSDISNDNVYVASAVPGNNTHGRAAILLVESLIHGLIARDVITVADAVEIVDVAAQVTTDISDDPDSSAAGVWEPVELLNAIGTSLRLDQPHD